MGGHKRHSAGVRPLHLRLTGVAHSERGVDMPASLARVAVNFSAWPKFHYFWLISTLRKLFLSSLTAEAGLLKTILNLTVK
eukprot:2682818-Amphidinium_carterae.2